MSNDTVELLEFYRKCDPTPSHDNVPSDFRMDKFSKQLSEIQGIEQKLGVKIEILFGHGREAEEVRTWY